MNFSRIAAAAAAAWIVDMAYGFLVFAKMMESAFGQFPSVFRAPDQMPLGEGAVSSLFGFLVFAYVYAKGYEGGSGVQEGLRFGVLIGLMLVLFGIVWQHVTVQISGTLAVYMTIATLVEFIIDGVVVGLIYRKRVAHARRSPA